MTSKPATPHSLLQAENTLDKQGDRTSALRLRMQQHAVPADTVRTIEGLPETQRSPVWCVFAAQQRTSAYASAVVATVLVLFVCIVAYAATCCMLLVLRILPKVQGERKLQCYGLLLRLLLLCMHQHGASRLLIHVSSSAAAAGGGKGANN